MADEQLKPSPCECDWTENGGDIDCAGCPDGLRLYRESAWHYRGKHWHAGCLIRELSANVKREVIGHPELAAALDRPVGDLPAARFVGVTEDGTLLTTLKTGRAAQVRERMIAVSPYWLGPEWEPGEIVNLNSFGDWRVTREEWSKDGGQWEYFGVPHVADPFETHA